MWLGLLSLIGMYMHQLMEADRDSTLTSRHNLVVELLPLDSLLTYQLDGDTKQQRLGQSAGFPE